MLMATDKIQAVRPLRVLFALPGLHRVARGAEAAFEDLARAMARRGDFDVTLIGSGAARTDEPYRYRRATCVPRETFEKWPSIPYLRGHYVYEELTFIPSLLRHYDPAEFDATLTCGYPYVNWALRMPRHGHRPKHIFITQNGDWMVQARNWEFKHFSCDGLVCTNPEYFARHRNRFPAALIPNGVDPHCFHPGHAERTTFGLPPDVPIVLIVAALIGSKRVLEGIRAVAAAGKLHLVVAGDGELRESVRKLGHELLGERFHHLVLPRGQMPQLYRAADMLLHMSQDEPFGNIYLEATATGLPVVAHRTPATEWILEDVGYLVDTDDQPAVVDALKQAIARPQNVEARRDLIERRFSWGRVAAEYGRFLQEVCR
jgi:glycosyltransferase involved in cell wall biosynthesis